jgi:HSP20 family protein
MAIVRWDPFSEMTRMQRMMDRMMEEPFSRSYESYLPTVPAMAVDLRETETEYIVKATVPGVKPEDVDITISDNILTIKANVQEEKETKEGTYHVKERRAGTYSRSFSLPTPVKAEESKAVFENGELTLTLPKSEESRVKRIEVKPRTSIEQPVEKH